MTPPLPAVPGTECVGRVLSVGQQISHVSPGDLVINLGVQNWAQRRRVKGLDVVRMPPNVDIRQAAMAKINPATAMFLLADVIDLKPGDWIIQNAANSAVGKMIIGLARKKGLRTVNIVRRDSVVPELERLGADVCILDGPRLAQRASEAAGGAPIRLGIDAIGGREAQRLGFAVAEEGTICNYGTLSGPDVIAASSDLIVRGIRYVGFWLSKSLRNKSHSEVCALYSEIGVRIAAGELSAAVEAVYPIEEISTAIEHEQRPGRSGKILVAPNGSI
jgi:NADPH:quinone reductase-like Zn-dependent oxidoreductase